MSASVPVLPESAPFNPAQRAFINGWVAAYYGGEAGLATATAAPAVTQPAAQPVEDFPWHDMSLPLDERMKLAEGKPLPRVLMAAMAQQDCGQCSYLCQSYAEAISSGSEKSLTRCVPGGKDTARMLKELMETVAPIAVVAAAALPAAPVPKVGAAPAARPGHAAAPGRFKTALPLNRAGSAKDTRQVVFDLAGSGLTYRPGDSIGIQPLNCPETVAAIIECLNEKPGTEVDCPDGSHRTLFDALSTVCDIGRPADAAVEVLASRAPDLIESQRLQALAEGYPGAEPEEADLLELLVTFPSARPPLQELISSLDMLQPRLYSIASSPASLPGEVHLAVAAVRYEKRGRQRKGVASTFLADRAAPQLDVPLFVQAPAHPFRVPAGEAPMIMIGPGTGIAPFRAFLQERRAAGVAGRNWLFFGDQHRATDFLFEEEIDGYHRDGLLTRLDLAFSRDQAERIYVQQRMREQSAELWSWLNDGAYLFVCGATAMGRDVEAALAAIVARQGGMGVGAAKAYIGNLARTGRYVKNVY